MESRDEVRGVLASDGERSPEKRRRCRARRCRAGVWQWPGWLTAAAAVVFLAAGAGSARAYPGGISGYSGKQGFTCQRCHDEGVPPLVEFEGPQRVLIDEMATFRFIVQSQSAEQLFAGFNVASSDGVLGIVADQDARVVDLELTHMAPKAVDGDDRAVWEFTWQAPALPGVQRLYGAGVSANGKEGLVGDGSAEAMPFAVVVTQLGDANCDGRISAADLAAEMKQAGGGLSATCDLGDTDCSGTVQENDVSTIVALVFDAAARAACVQ